MSWWSGRKTGLAALPVEGRLPGFDGATGWLNSLPLDADDLRGKVVLVDFWTYTCINWLRTLGYLRAWAEKYHDHGLVVVGVHTPEFPFERDADNVREAASELRVEYPIALDPDYAVWSAFSNRYWPAAYFADAEGRIRHHQFGEGDYEMCERVIQQLLRDSGGRRHPGRHRVPRKRRRRGPGRLDERRISRDLPRRPAGTQLRLARRRHGQRSSHVHAAGKAETELLGALRELDRRAAARASWTKPAERSRSASTHATSTLYFDRATGDAVPFRVHIDGAAPAPHTGWMSTMEGSGALVQPRLYQLVRQQGPIVDRTFEITFLQPGVEAYVFTFG